VNPFHERLARIGLQALSAHGFALAGGYAVQAHGIVNRLSEDVDLLTTAATEASFPAVVRLAIDAYETAGLTVEVVADSPGFARFQITDPASKESSKVELGIDWRRDLPVAMPIGPVLSADDAVANKVTALYSRAQARDYIDVDAAVSSGRYDRSALLFALLSSTTPGSSQPCSPSHSEPSDVCLRPSSPPTA